MYYVVQDLKGDCKTKELEGVVDGAVFRHDGESTPLSYLELTPEDARLAYLKNLRDAIDQEERLIEQARVRRRGLVARYAAAVDSPMEVEKT